MKRLFFFADHLDLSAIFKYIEEIDILFTKLDNLTIPFRDHYSNPRDIPNLGFFSCENEKNLNVYLITYKNEPIVYNNFIDKKGCKRWTIHNSDNENSIVLHLGGQLPSGTLLESNVSTLHDTSGAQFLMKAFLKAFKKTGFIKIGMPWIGPSSMDLLKSGGRLTAASEAASREYDFKLQS